MKARFYLSAISAYIIWGMFSLVLRPIREHAPLDILFYRIFICLGIAAPVVLLFMRKRVRENLAKFRLLAKSERRALIGWNVLAGLLLTGNWFLFIYVMNFVSVRATSLAYLVCPIMTALLAAFLLKEPMKKLQWAALLIGICGCLILSVGHVWDLLLSVLVGLSYAIYLIIQRKNKGFDNFLLLTFHIIVSVATLLPFFPFFAADAPSDGKFYIFVSIIAVGLTLLPLLLNLYALKGIPSSTVGMLINVNPIIAFLLATFYFKESADAWQIAGYSVVFVSVVVFNLPAVLGRRG